MGHRPKRLDGSYGLMIPGPGVASGGVAGQILYKTDSVDYRTHWDYPLDAYTKTEVDAIVAGITAPGIPGIASPYAVSDFKNGIYSIGAASLTVDDLWMEDIHGGAWGPWDPAIDIVPGSGMTNMGSPTGNRGPVSTPALFAAVNVTAGFTMVMDINPDRVSASPGGFSLSAIDDLDVWNNAIVTDQRSNFVRHIRWDNGASYSETTPITETGLTRIVTTVSADGTTSYLNTGLAIESPGHPVSLLPLSLFGIWTKESSDLAAESFLEWVAFYPLMSREQAWALALAAGADSGGAAVWGTITGTLGDQADLAAALADKLSVTDDSYWGGGSKKFSAGYAFTVGDTSTIGSATLTKGDSSTGPSLELDQATGAGGVYLIIPKDGTGGTAKLNRYGAVTAFEFNATPLVGANNIYHAGNLVAFTSVAAGLVPASGGGTANFLRADGTWAAPPGGGGGVTSFNSRTGAVTLTSSDVTTALTFTPATSAVFTSGANGLAPASGGGSVNFLCADGTWKTPATGVGSVAWGAITGTLSDQTDLQAALNAKVPMSSQDAYSYYIVKGLGATKDYGSGTNSIVAFDPWNGSGTPGFVYGTANVSGVFSNQWTIGVTGSHNRSLLQTSGTLTGWEFEATPYVGTAPILTNLTGVPMSGQTTYYYQTAKGLMVGSDVAKNCNISADSIGGQNAAATAGWWLGGQTANGRLDFGTWGGWPAVEFSATPYVGTKPLATTDLVTSGAAGLAPASGGGTTNFLRADGTWAAPAGGGGGPLTDGDYGDVVVGGTGTTMTVESAAGSFAVGANLTFSGYGSFVVGSVYKNTTYGLIMSGFAGSSSEALFVNSAGTSVWQVPLGTNTLYVHGSLTFINAGSRLSLAASAAGGASINLLQGAAPTSPVNGDIWTTSAALFYRLNGVTLTSAVLEGSTFTGKVVTVGSASGGAGFNLPHGSAPSAPVNGDMWSTTTGFFARLNGGNKTFAFTDSSITGTAGSVTSSLSFQVTGGVAPGTAYNGGVARTIDYSSVGALPATPRKNSTTSASTLDPTFSNDIVERTTQTVNLTVSAPTGTAIDGMKQVIRIKATAAALTFAMNAIYRAIGVTIPSSLTNGKWLYLACIYNSTDTKWDVVAVSQEA